MIIWLNGPFGIGKTTTADLLAERLPGSRIFDPETVGIILRPTLQDARPVADFRQWPPWRSMVAEGVVSIHRYLDGDGNLVVPQTVPEQGYWHEIRERVDAAGIPLLHVCLIADESEHERRIDQDEALAAAAGWRRASTATFREAMDWLAEEAEVVDTTGLSVDAVARRVADLVAGRSRQTRPPGRLGA